jgi:hypothetical protein
MILFYLVMFFFLGALGLGFRKTNQRGRWNRKVSIHPRIHYVGCEPHELPFRKQECGCWVDKKGNIAETKNLSQFLEERKRIRLHDCKQKNSSKSDRGIKEACCKGKCQSKKKLQQDK